MHQAVHEAGLRCSDIVTPLPLTHSKNASNHSAVVIFHHSIHSQTNNPRMFVIQSLVVWAIAEGRGAAAKVDQFLMKGEGEGEGEGEEEGQRVPYPRGIELAKELATEVHHSHTILS